MNRNNVNSERSITLFLNNTKDRSGEMKSFRFGKNGCVIHSSVFSDGVVDRDVFAIDKMQLFLRSKIHAYLNEYDLLIYLVNAKKKRFGVITH